jgi:hypothetical protein
MTRPLSVVVSRDEMDQLVDAVALLNKIRRGGLTDAPILRARRDARTHPGGVSDIVRHENVFGYHVATTHRITAADGTVPHWHCKDLRMGEVLIRYED